MGQIQTNVSKSYGNVPNFARSVLRCPLLRVYSGTRVRQIGVENQFFILFRQRSVQHVRGAQRRSRLFGCIHFVPQRLAQGNDRQLGASATLQVSQLAGRVERQSPGKGSGVLTGSVKQGAGSKPGTDLFTEVFDGTITGPKP